MLADSFRNNLQRMLDGCGRGVRSQLARHLDVSPAYISRLLAGHAIPNLDTIERVAAFFHLPPTRMLQDQKI